MSEDGDMCFKNLSKIWQLNFSLHLFSDDDICILYIKNGLWNLFADILEDSLTLMSFRCWLTPFTISYAKNESSTFIVQETLNKTL